MAELRRASLRRGVALLNRLLAPLDRMAMARNGGDTPAPLFILGAPRSGTTLSYQVITQNIEVCYFTAVLGYCYGLANVYFRLTHRIVKRPRPRYTSRFGSIRGLFAPSEHANFWLQWFPEDEVSGHQTDPQRVDWERFALLRDYVASFTAITRRPLVVKNLYLGLNAGLLARIFPDARFVWVERDPLLTCQSMLLARRAAGRPHSWWSVKIPRYRELQQEPMWRQIGEQWHWVSRRIGEDLERFAPGRYMRISYEELCGDPHGVLDALEHWLRPLGYRSYPERRLPQHFPISDALKLDRAEAEGLSSYLNGLEELRRGS